MGECREWRGRCAACRFLLPFFPKAKPDYSTAGLLARSSRWRLPGRMSECANE